MWQLTDQSSSSSATSPSSWVELKSNSTEDDDQEKQVVKKNTLIEISSQMERSEENGHASNLELGKEEVAPLIHLEDGEDDNWEAALLEASLNNSSHDHRMNFLIYPNSFSNGYGDGQGYKNQLFCLEDHTKREEQDQWQLRVNPNPFCQPCSN